MNKKNIQQVVDLNENIFSDTIEHVPIRNGFGTGLVEAAAKDSRIVGLCADLTESTRMEEFAKKFPNHFIEVGITEQNLASVASGMAAMGKIPFISSYAVFSPGRNWEQIRTTICYNDVPVKIAGSHAGISVGPDGGTHQALEDIALMRVLPNIDVLVPCDAIEAHKATCAIALTSKPSYIRLAREKTPIVTSDKTPFEIGKANIVFKSESETFDVAIVACGTLVYQAILAAKELDEQGIKIIVVNMHTIKPIDTGILKYICDQAGAIVTAEEHQIAGGLGGAVSEFVVSYRPVPIEFIGIKDVYGQSGKPDELMDFYNLNQNSIEQAVYTILSRK
jgi:transketolase